MRHLILGGARSGKSRFAEQLAHASGLPVTVIVTAQALDEEMRDRIARHRQDRPAHWQVVESPMQLPEAIRAHAREGRCVIVDCLTLWLSNLLCNIPASLPFSIEELQDSIRHSRGTLLVVSNEVGWGITPDNALARRFQDEAGRLHQQLASICDKATLVVAGLPLYLKPVTEEIES